MDNYSKTLYIHPTHQCNVEWPWTILSDLASRGLSASAELPVFTARCIMHKRGICCYPVSVCLSVTFQSCAKTNKDIFEIFFTIGYSDTILVIPYQRGCRYSDGNPPPNRGVEFKGVWKIADFFHEYLAVSQKWLYLDGHMQRGNL